ncbi:HEPN domain-containing protein [Zhongshania sp. BJYM1]|uniref:HEPN domain-containing protein n=1 Tax=Zhongshania aquatica TaxID=2965069 RepID=UPI0022B3A295|nr:HEPN domain-containing protein [Marortus sp. BJYM1]
MGRVKEEWMEYMDNQAMYEWIEENYGDDAGEEGSDAWNEAVQAFEDYCENQARLEQEAWEQDEYDYYLYLTLNDVDKIFYQEISNLKQLLENSQAGLNNPTLCKMVYAHAVTILEVYLEDMVKALIISNEGFLKNTIKNVKPFSDSRFKLGDISLEHDGIKKFVLRKLSDNLFHDIPKAINIISGIIESKLSINIESICAITATRHDIVHRNGKNKEGVALVIDKSEAGRSIMTVESFAKELRNAL